MFGWVGDVIDWIGDGISSAWDNTVGVVTSDAARMVFDVIFNCIFIMIYNAIADIFTWINETSADIFDLAWINAFISLFHHIGWGLFVCGLIPCQHDVRKDSDYAKRSLELLEMCDTLEKRLSADDKKLLNEITDMQGMLSETMVAESYIQGFRDCAELIIDVMFGRSENLK